MRLEEREKKIQQPLCDGLHLAHHSGVVRGTGTEWEVGRYPFPFLNFEAPLVAMFLCVLCFRY